VSELRLRIEPADGAPFLRDLDRPELVLGRSSKTDVVINDRFLSRVHARIVQRADEWLLEDMGSRNPTRLNGVPVAGPTAIKPGDVILMAESRVIVEGPNGSAEASGQGARGSDTLPGSAIFRSVSTFFEPEAGAAGAQDPLARSLAERLKLLNEVHRALAGPITLEALFDMILERAFAHLQPEEGAVFLRKDDGSFAPAASRRLPGATGELLYSRRLAQEVAVKGMAALVTDAGIDERFARAESIMISGVRSIVAAPLLDSEGSHGMIVLSARQRVRPFDENDMELLAALASAAALRIRNLALAEETARRRLLDKELDLARDIQMGMLPRAFPVSREVELSATLRPARTVGGDLYDVVEDGPCLWLIVGDVSGKGVGAALYMAVTKTLFRAIAPGEASVASALDRMNRELARDNDRAMFVTAFAARLDRASGTLEYVNAGHNPTYRLAAKGEIATLPGPIDPALGALEGHEYRNSTVRLEPGDRVVAYTDGVVEARDARGGELTAGGLEEYLRGCGDVGPEGLVRGLAERVEAFAGGAPQYDDVTILALRYRAEG
jgi:sigma-B regulation protein RsbU (phosphoserine phosphatase)